LWSSLCGLAAARLNVCRGRPAGADHLPDGTDQSDASESVLTAI
jgi:hypothetical protein